MEGYFRSYFRHVFFHPSMYRGRLRTTSWYKEKRKDSLNNIPVLTLNKDNGIVEARSSESFVKPSFIWDLLDHAAKGVQCLSSIRPFSYNPRVQLQGMETRAKIISPIGVGLKKVLTQPPFGLRDEFKVQIINNVQDGNIVLIPTV